MSIPETEVRISVDPSRGGISVELGLVSGAEHRMLCEIFYSGKDPVFTFGAADGVQLPLARIEEFVRMGRMIGETATHPPA